MTLELNARCKARLVELIEGALPKLRVENGKFLRWREAFDQLADADRALPQQGQLHDRIAAYVDENPIFEFVTSTLTDELRSHTYSSDATTASLTSLAGYEDARAVAEPLVAQFVSLPNDYAVTFLLPKDLWPVLQHPDVKLEVGPQMRLVRYDVLVTDFPIEIVDDDGTPVQSTGILSAILGRFPFPTPAWQEDAVYLQIDAKGFIGGYAGSTPDVEARRNLRSFCGFGLALGLLNANTRGATPTLRSPYFVHIKFPNGEWKFQNSFELDDSASRGLDQLTMNTLNGWVNSVERQKAWTTETLSKMSEVLSVPQKAEPLMLAAQWYFDSATGSGELLQYIQAMVVLEILLGDKAASKEIGLNELMKNRCAYLIGTSHTERTSLQKLFSEIYDVRSQIVHQGKHRFLMKERILLQQLRILCRRVIQKEIELLIADRKKG